MRGRWILAVVVLAAATPVLAVPLGGEPPPTAARPAPLADDNPAAPVALPAASAVQRVQAAVALAAPELPVRAPEKHTLAPFSLGQFLASALVAVLAGFVSALAAPMIRDHLTQRNDAKISGLRLALLLEGHAIRCARVYSDTHDALQRHEVRQEGPAPLPEYPEDTAWRAMGYRLTEAALLFPVHRADLISEAYADAEYLDLPSLAAEIADASLNIGWSAIETAQTLREGLKLPPASLDGLKRTKTFLAERREHKAKLRAQFEAARAKAATAMADPEDLLA